MPDLSDDLRTYFDELASRVERNVTLPSSPTATSGPAMATRSIARLVDDTDGGGRRALSLIRSRRTGAFGGSPWPPP